MFIQEDNEVTLPFGDDIVGIITEENETEWETGSFEIDGTGRLTIVNTGGTAASEGGMGSGSQGGREKGDLKGRAKGIEGGIPNTDSDKGWDPVKENIDEATAERNSDEKDE